MMKKLKRFVQSLKYYVIADPGDNSITFSKRLFSHIKKNANDGDAAEVFVFLIAGEEKASYGFMVNPGIKEPTQLCNIQYNSEHKCLGFESLCPSVNRIIYEYGLPAQSPIKLSVSVKKTATGKIYYQFERPDEKLVRKYQKA